MFPVTGSIATTAPFMSPSASQAAFCTFGSMVSSIDPPVTGLPENRALICSKNCDEFLPVKKSFDAASRPVAPLKNEK